MYIKDIDLSLETIVLIDTWWNVNYCNQRQGYSLRVF